MRILVVYAHPEEHSFVGALHVRICERLRARGHEIDDLDLYAERFDPVMSRYTYDHYWIPTPTAPRSSPMSSVS